MKKKIVWLSDTPLIHTGYANQTFNILNRLSDDYECHQLAHNYVGQTLPPRGVTFKDGTQMLYTHHGASGRAAYCQDLILPKLQELQADAFVVLLDTFMLWPWILNYNFSPARSFFYFPSDGGGGLPLNCEHILRHFNHPIAMSKFAQKQAKDGYNINAEYIPHAVDTDLFRPYSAEERQRFRDELTVVTISGAKIKGGLRGKFVVGIVSRNQGRKHLDRALKAFAHFCKDRPDTILLLHCDPNDPAAVSHLPTLAGSLGLHNRVVFTDMRWTQNFENKDMPRLYNCMDIFFLPTSGEGFGIPTVEAMACGIPVVVTDYTNTSELLIDETVCGFAVPIITELTGTWNVNRAIMHEEEAAKCLATLYGSVELRTRLGENGRAKAIKCYSWDVVIPQWKALLKRTLE